jgi:hypothetical protein
MTRKNRRLNEKLGMGCTRGRKAEKSLSFCHLTKQRLINELADGVNERHRWHDDSLSDYRPKFRVFTEKANRANYFIFSSFNNSQKNSPTSPAYIFDRGQTKR